MSEGVQCPSCGSLAGGDNVLAEDQLWCSDVDCPIVSFDASRLDAHDYE